MRKIHLLFTLPLCLFLSFFGYAYTVEESGTWTTEDNPFAPGQSDVYIQGELRIPKGINVTIEGMNFYFDGDGILIIEAGDDSLNAAKLSLDNTLLSADLASTQLWQGVRVLGIASEDQLGDGGRKQAKLNMSNEAMIEYAVIGVRAGQEDCSTCGGGIVNITDSKFKDNPTGLYFDPYQRYVNGAEAQNYGKVENTHFTWTADLRALSSITPLRHIDVRESSGLAFRGNRYENEDYTNYAITDRGTGIYSANSQLSEKWLCAGVILPCPENQVVRSEFTNLTVGIDAYGNSSNRTLEAHYGKYRGNFIGISTNGLIRPEILNNDIRVPNVQKSAGISLVGSTGYVVENNTITGMAKLNITSNFGILVQASGEDNNELYNNTFRYLSVGIQSTLKNANFPTNMSGLKWKCNTFDSPIMVADIYVFNGMVSVIQGNCNVGVTGPACNIFSHSSRTVPSHYGIKCNSHIQINYRHHYRGHKMTGEVTARLRPLRFTNSFSVPGDWDYIQLNPCGVKWSHAACPIKSSGAPSADPLGPGLVSESGLRPSMSEFEQMAETLYNQIDAIEPRLDGGRTDEMMEAISGGANAEIIKPLLEDAGDKVSERVLNAMHASRDEEVQALAYATAGHVTNTAVTADNFNDITLPSNEIENQWMPLRFAEDDMWMEIIAAYQKDTVNAYPAEMIMGMLDQYQPKTFQRFTALLASETGSTQPGWLRPGNSLANATEFAALPIQDSDGRLPNKIDDWFINGYFNDFANTYALNTAYIKNGDAYLPHVAVENGLEGSGKSGQGKSMKPDEDDQSDEMEIILLPNPFDESLTIRAVFVENIGAFATLRFYDALGREVMTREIPAETGDRHIDGRNLPEGLLIYTVEIDGRVIKSGKVVKQR